MPQITLWGAKFVHITSYGGNQDLSSTCGVLRRNFDEYFPVLTLDWLVDYMTTASRKVARWSDDSSMREALGT